jgi:hypothetical protein
MSTLKLMTAAILASALMGVMGTQVNAQTTSVEVECDVTGSYGQRSTCRSSATGSVTGQNGQQVVIRDGGKGGHQTVDAGMDIGTALIALGTTLSGSVATVIKLKNRVA